MKLYKITFIKNGSDRKRLYQIPATSEFNALVKLGQTFCSEDTEIEVVDIRIVKSFLRSKL